MGKRVNIQPNKGFRQRTQLNTEQNWLERIFKALAGLFMVLMLFSASVSAKVYDLYNPNVGICPGGVLEYKTNSYQYVCHASNGWINFNVGDRIVWSGPKDKTVLLTVKKGMNFPGNNQVGTLASPVSLHTVQATIMFVGPDIVVTGKTSVGPAGYHVSAESNRVKLLGGVLNQSPNGFVSVRGSNNEIKGGVNAVGHIYLENVQVTGNIASSTNYVSVKGTGNQIDGNIIAFNKVELNETKVNGNIESQGATVDITGTGNEVNGDIVALSYVRLNDTKVVGNVVSHGTQVETTGSSNEVYGDVTALQKINLHNTKVCGTVTSTGQAVKMTGTNNAVYDEHSAIDAWYDIDLSNALICGSLTSHLAPISSVNTSLHCGFNDPNCSYAPSNCPETSVRVCSGDSPPAAEKIEVNPRNYHLTCESTPENMVEVSVLDGDGNLLEGYRPTLSQDSGTNLDIQFVSEAGGISKFRVINNTPNTVGNYSLSASLKVSNTITLSDSDTIKYVPYKFEVSDQSVIAGKPIDVPIKVKACSNSGQLIDLGYVGSPSASYSYQKPVTASAFPSLLQFNADLTDSNRNARLIFQDAGQILVTITDNNFQCDEAYCPVEGGALKGQFMVQSRPWKIAICDVENSDGTIENPAKTDEIAGYFISAGEEFRATFKPIVHPQFYQSPPSDECQYQTTFNYYSETGHAAPLSVGLELAYPNTGVLGNLANDRFPGDYTFMPNDKVGSTRQKTLRFSWQEVGSLKMKTSAMYLSMSLNVDNQTIGRFYPDYFRITQSDWTAPDSQGGSTYMGQPFKQVDFAITAFSAADKPTSNYGNFADYLKGAFFLWGAYSARLDISDSELTASNWSGAVWAQSWDNRVVWRKLESATLGASLPDGPYNSARTTDSSVTIDSHLSLTLDKNDDSVSDSLDPTQFKIMSGSPSTLHQELLNQPDVRYGRMMLDDVAGNSGQSIHVPLRVEYWQGKQGFQTNVQDDNSQFDTSLQCRDIVWTEADPAVSDSLLTSDPEIGVISAGQGDTVFAKQTTNQREQVRLFLRQGSAQPNGISCAWSQGSQPWLQFNWRDQGDEDPSSIVTFGIHRGNDRVIYRGEPDRLNRP
ncbi:MSHA biogenesis protein MshQ [Vibrio crassostreae]|nr:hypothetical protein EDB37_100420 [Vibrio crassostreae]CAK2430308.1 MSHA biogenesis protein MshQ [Vibrio crassostreae]CAK2487765.1 MSHA biogenesis protein MshQ [Vibrio crassostreae]CAK3665744.1 MSHA biogenesis protein MshQ [Vibrio crassostreae]CAK3817768.1 MSHA biogenesis protein MshQ [Vibrio crassostreae]